mgnify:CR=1 FL=1
MIKVCAAAVVQPVLAAESMAIIPAASLDPIADAARRKERRLRKKLREAAVIREKFESTTRVRLTPGQKLKLQGVGGLESEFLLLYFNVISLSSALTLYCLLFFLFRRASCTPSLQCCSARW